ncbi:hypothetical protein [Streptomyces sp. NPDC005004]
MIGLPEDVVTDEAVAVVRQRGPQPRVLLYAHRRQEHYAFLPHQAKPRSRQASWPQVVLEVVKPNDHPHPVGDALESAEEFLGWDVEQPMVRNDGVRGFEGTSALA